MEMQKTAATKTGEPCTSCARPLCSGTRTLCARCDPPQDMQRRDRAPFDGVRRQRIRWPPQEGQHVGAAIGLGPKPCRWCGEPCVGRRTSWCSDTCADTYTALSSAGSLDHLIRQRDGNNCRRCGMDLDALRYRIKRMRHPPDTWNSRRLWEAREVVERAGRVLRRLGFNPDGAHYEVDHIVPVADGGGGLGMANLRLLCVPCHKRVTAEWQSRRAAKARSRRRRDQRFPGWG